MTVTSKTAAQETPFSGTTPYGLQQLVWQPGDTHHTTGMVTIFSPPLHLVCPPFSPKIFSRATDFRDPPQIITKFQVDIILICPWFFVDTFAKEMHKKGAVILVDGIARELEFYTKLWLVTDCWFGKFRGVTPVFSNHVQTTGYIISGESA